MTRRWWLTGVCGLLLASATEGEPDRPGKSPWVSDLAAAERLARDSGKPILVVFRCEH
jgi:hypothetical protein